MGISHQHPLDETAQITTTTVDDEWSAGYVGLVRGRLSGDTQQFDDVTVFIDNDEDGILDAADPTVRRR
ncbi:MAG: hypothetical protein ABIG44_14895 [Planctomycetota bacterium]